jgi:hypothetical protein
VQSSAGCCKLESSTALDFDTDGGEIITFKLVIKFL